MKKINFHQEIGSFNGTKFTHKDNLPATLENIVLDTLASPEASKDLSGKEKTELYRLAQKIIINDDKTEWSSSEIAKLQEIIGKVQPSAVIVGICHDFLENGN